MLTKYTGATLVDRKGDPPVTGSVIDVGDERMSAMGTKDMNSEAYVGVDVSKALLDVHGHRNTIQ
jgi:hypothetical protein